jgi:hypothetical protein
MIYDASYSIEVRNLSISSEKKVQNSEAVQRILSAFGQRGWHCP